MENPVREQGVHIQSTVQLAEELALELDKAEALARAAYEDHATATIRAQRATDVATVAVNLAEVAKAAADSFPTSVSRDAAMHAAQRANVAITIAATAAVARGATKDVVDGFVASRNSMAITARKAGATTHAAIQQATASQHDINTLDDDSEDGAVIDEGAENILGDDDEEECGIDDESTNKQEPNLCFITPMIPAAQSALKDIGLLLRPKWKKGPGYVDPGLDPLTWSRLQWMEAFLWAYVDPAQGKGWIDASFHTVQTFQKGTYTARKLCEWARNYRKTYP